MNARIPVLRSALVALGLALLTGCALTQASNRIEYGGIRAAFPKDSEIGCVVFQETVSSNGTSRTLTMSNCVFRMNPQVIQQATAHDTELIRATAQALSSTAAAVR